MLVRVLLATALALIAPSPRRVAIGVVPQIVMANHGIVVSCRVPRNPANRGVDVTLYPVQSSYRQLDGENAAVTTTMRFDQVPCDAERVECELHTQGESNAIASVTVLVAGCGE